ncbi:nitrogenase component 1 [Anaerotignum sp.]|uniref:nitrogenase component 1 n=1 Tax=Anaerotignum sp. TaxID=2039241 RepID=UPI003331F737
MSCSCQGFGKTLHYVSPAHGGWGVIRIAALVPESYQLFISPFACGRHGALGGVVNGIKDRISYLYIDESDIVSGNYEDLIPEAVEELFENLDQRPKVLLLFVSCLDDLLGTDHVQLNKRLAQQYPDVEFRSCHMNPISLDTPFPPGITLQNSIYSLLKKKTEREEGINLIGNNVPINKECELFSLMESVNYKVHHITDFDSFDEFQTMAMSRLNVVLSPVAEYASRTMVDTLEINRLLAYHTYDLKEICGFYEELAFMLEVPLDVSRFAQEAKVAIEVAREKIGNRSIAIDYQGVRKPFTLARALIEYGFSVKLVMTDDIKPFDKEAYEYLLKNHKEVEILNALHHDMAKTEDRNSDFLCIGFNCAYATGAKNVVNIIEDESLFGFYGVKKLMEMLIEANEVDLKEVIEGAGLVI